MAAAGVADAPSCFLQSVHLSEAGDDVDDEELLSAFRSFASFGAGAAAASSPLHKPVEMDGPRFAKLCRETGLQVQFWNVSNLFVTELVRVKHWDCCMRVWQMLQSGPASLAAAAHCAAAGRVGELWCWLGLSCCMAQPVLISAGPRGWTLPGALLAEFWVCRRLSRICKQMQGLCWQTITSIFPV